MKITVVGRGNVGGGLADLWERAGHEVTRLGRDGGEVADADAVLLAVPGDAVVDAFESVRAFEGKTVIDATNRYGVRPPDGFASNAEFVKSRTNGPTAKAFNTNFASLLGFGRVLDWTDGVFEEFSGWFNGKTSPVHLFWHGFDLAVTRFSGRPAPALDTDPVTHEAYSHEVISFGFWPGDDTLGDAAYYAYTAPEPQGLREQPLPIGAWMESGTGSLAVLPYEAVRTAHDPGATLLAFCQAAYEAGGRLAGWDIASFESRWSPRPAELQRLQATAGRRVHESDTPPLSEIRRETGASTWKP